VYEQVAAVPQYLRFGKAQALLGANRTHGSEPTPSQLGLLARGHASMFAVRLWTAEFGHASFGDTQRYSPGIGPNSVNFGTLDGAQAGLLAVPLKAVVCCR
jgi:hypothetical protein